MTRPAVSKPGAALRAFRRKLGWTLSRIENDQISPTFDQLSKLSLGLSVDLGQLLSGDMEDSKPVQTARRSVNRAGEGQLLDTPMQALRYLSVDLTNKHFAPIIGEVKARSLPEAGEFHRHDGEEFVCVIAGELRKHSRRRSGTASRPGDSVDASGRQLDIQSADVIKSVIQIASISRKLAWLSRVHRAMSSLRMKATPGLALT